MSCQQPNGNGRPEKSVTFVNLRQSCYLLIFFLQFTYLSILNQTSGRTPSDATQYPVFRKPSSQTKATAHMYHPSMGIAGLRVRKFGPLIKKCLQGVSLCLHVDCLVDLMGVKPDTADGCADPSTA